MSDRNGALQLVKAPYFLAQHTTYKALAIATSFYVYAPTPANHNHDAIANLPASHSLFMTAPLKIFI
ncbi:hypothetical protein THF5H11_50243 [Vibrio jasicida]|nr:hypothetical protein THF5H11_50243 [Vibrio jasicida]